MTPARPLVKICGLTRPDDALVAARAGADLLGIVFARGSRRAVGTEKAREIVLFVRGWYEQTNARRALTPQCGPADELIAPKFVGVFADERVENISEIGENAGLDIIQLHGDETPEMARLLTRPVIKAIRVRDSVPDVSEWNAAEWILFDAASGGSGEPFDWALLHHVGRPFLLAGGLSPDNVAAAIRTTGAAGVDVATGVESAPGVKDPARVIAFIDAARTNGPSNAHLRTEN